MSKLHFLRYGTAAEQRYMSKYQHTYNGVAINGSMLAHIPKGISAFMHKGINKKFIIDPMTHSFQHELDKIQNSSGDIKSSIKKLIEIYGDPVTSIKSKLRPIRDTDFNQNNIPGFVKNVLDFQCRHIKKNLDAEYSAYIKYIEENFRNDANKLSKEPILLIAPYFYIQENTYNNWNNLNLHLITEAMKLKSFFRNKKIFAQLVIDKRLLLDTQKVQNIIKDYSIADGLIYWISDFDETTASIEELSAVRSLIKLYKSQNSKKEIISLYSGFFSELLLSEGLDGVVHGLEYGESRDVAPVGGGIPLSKYYLRDIKKRVDAATMLMLLKLLRINSPNKFYDEICRCEVCRNHIKTDVVKDFSRFIRSKPDPVIIRYKKTGNIREIFYPDRESKELCLFHYLEVKNDEFISITKDGIDKKLEALRSAYKKYKSFLPESEISHLNRWAEVFSA